MQGFGPFLLSIGGHWLKDIYILRRPICFQLAGIVPSPVPIHYFVVRVPYHPVTTHVCLDETGIGKLHNCTHSLTFTAPFSVGHGSGPSLGLDQWDGELQWVWVGLGDRTLPHTPGAHQHSSKPWDGAWKLILVSLCCSFSLFLHKCLTDAHSCFPCSGFTFVYTVYGFDKERGSNGKEEEIPFNGNKHFLGGAVTG